MKTNIVSLKLFEEEDVKLPVVLTIAGSDSSGGAGIEADLKTFSAFDVYGMTCITALTAQNTTGVKTYKETSRELVHEILKANLEDMYENEEKGPLKVIKTGMLTKSAIEELAQFDLKIKMVIDPVMVTTSGSKLLDHEGVKLCVDNLMKNAFLVTPNFVEAETIYKILGKSAQVKQLDEFIKFTVDLQKMVGCKNILVKGGHIPFDANGKVVEDTTAEGQAQPQSNPGLKVIDVLYESENDVVTIFESKYIESDNSHGTGCTLASAIAANIAKGTSLADSVAIGIDYIHQGMLKMSKLGHGKGPLNHNVKPREAISDLVNTTLNNQVKFDENFTLLDYLINHPDVKRNWETYATHPFVELVAKDEMPFEKFFYYLKQDYHYLIVYARMHGLAASKAPTYKESHAQATIIGEIVTEIEKHKEKLKAYNVDYDKDDVPPGDACVRYCNYLLDIGMREDFLGIKVALAPCLHGYADAGAFGKRILQQRQHQLKQQEHGSDADADADTGAGASTNDTVTPHEYLHIYRSWLDDYTSEWFLEADAAGKEALQRLSADGLSEHRLKELVKIFNDVTLLEINFWSEVLELDV
ncbi:hypothetical protein LELG_01321 [Lodderomyces elongisporus NRRL YB-4239]|uniref:Phosphomethylpyrimidine kinase THI20 n=1 Tax=Lodderomyces elongisporus (strain ATCC 11503 / CBS 2605 / JCM 1781 / NBRC 1676 / NRRL YB-4239) TaxID=379508 RepID=A5DVD5_LODEL|nr:hypothetical protein LELG_01321 [Lodderomyces elongisporus NRRL YB-4239]